MCAKTYSNKELTGTILEHLKEGEITDRHLAHLLQYLVDNRQKFIAKIRQKERRESLSVDIANVDVNSLVKQWTMATRVCWFSKSLIDMRFSPEQGKAFKLISYVTKYRQFERRDGSVISYLKSNTGDLITDPKHVAGLLVEHLTSNEQTMLSKLGGYKPTIPKKLPDLPDTTIRRLISCLPKGKALPALLFPDEALHTLAQDESRSISFLNAIWDPKFLEANNSIYFSPNLCLRIKYTLMFQRRRTCALYAPHPVYSN